MPGKYAFGGMSAESRERGRVQASRSRSRLRTAQRHDDRCSQDDPFNAIDRGLDHAGHRRRSSARFRSGRRTSPTVAPVEPPKGTPEVPGGDIFGFTNPTDIGDPCEWYLRASIPDSPASGTEAFSHSSKSGGRLHLLENLAFAFSAFTAYNKWSNVSVLQDALRPQGRHGHRVGQACVRRPSARSCCAWSRASRAAFCIGGFNGAALVADRFGRRHRLSRGILRQRVRCSSTWRSRSACSPR